MAFPKLAKTELSQLHSLGPEVPFTVNGRVHKVQSGQPNGVTSITLRHKGHFVTAVLQPDATDQEAVDKADPLTEESLLRVSGVVLQNHEGQVNSAVAASTKIQVASLTVISEAKERLPNRTISHGGPGEVPNPQETSSALINQRLDNRVLDLRVAATAAIFKLFSGIYQLTVEYLSEHDFQWVATPELINYQAPGDDDYFELLYLGGQRARLTQTSEFHLGLALAADLERVYDIHTVFRREPLTMVEVVFTLTDGWLEVLEGAENMIVHLVKSLQEREKYQSLVAQTKRLYPLAGTFKLGLDDQGRLPRTTFKQAKQILRGTLGFPAHDTDDFTREEEAVLGRYVASPKSTLGPPSDVFVITHYPKNIRPFNHHPSDDDPENTTHSFDIILCGQECCTSAQFPHSYRHSYKDIRAAMTATDPPIDPDSPEWHAFTAAHEAGMLPWGGYGVGLNRVVQGFLGLEDIHETVLFPRDASRLVP